MKIWIPMKVAWIVFWKSLWTGWVDVSVAVSEETNDSYYYVNGEYVCHVFVPAHLTKEENYN